MDYESRLSLNRIQVREISKFARRLLKIKTVNFPVLKALEKLIDKFPKNLYYRILPDDDFETNVMAELVPDGSDVYCIKIRETVYEKAVYGDRANLGFICHEMCHFILIYIFDAGPVLYANESGLVYTRKFKDKELPRYKSMEWQAMALCGEIMIPYEKCKNYTFKQIVSRTNSSDEQTKYFLRWVVKLE
ncbi:MAG TPA: hypothetical protein DDW20_00565 [Firmicutes bacterium]|nr:hypothetical protein [Bacillota bacterium]